MGHLAHKGFSLAVVSDHYILPLVSSFALGHLYELYILVLKFILLWRSSKNYRLIKFSSLLLIGTLKQVERYSSSINRGYYMMARTYEVYHQVEKYFTSESIIIIIITIIIIIITITITIIIGYFILKCSIGIVHLNKLTSRTLACCTLHG